MLYRFAKRAFDLACAVLLLALLLPILVLIGLCILLRSGRPVLFRQRRVGCGGKLFRVIKFRTIRTGPHNPKNPQAHLIPFGGFLRRYALDELPQLWNVLHGEMSIVGPRPILPAEAEGYSPRERRRLRVRPGLTGWAQIKGRNALPWHERIAHDLWYVENRSLALDLRILAKTPEVLLSGEGVYGPGNRDPSAEDLAVRRLSSSNAA